MKHIMNIQKFNVKAAAAVAAAVAGLCGCSDWTRPEALDVAPEMQESSEEMLAAIRAFKQTDHKIVVLGMEATPDAPVARYQHVTSMPDSADYIYIRDLVGGLNSAIAPEIAEVRSKKGTKVLADVDYMSIQEAWQDMQDDKIDAGEPQGTEDEFAAYCKEQTEAQLACCSTYGCDGIMVSYNGSATFDWHRTGRAAFLNAIADWYGQNSSKEMIVRGTLNLIVQNTVAGSDEDDPLYDLESFLGNCRYIIYAIGENTIDADVNRGFTSGMVGANFFTFDFSPYHTIRIYARLFSSNCIQEVRVRNRKIADITLFAAGPNPIILCVLKVLFAMEPALNRIQVGSYARYTYSASTGTFTSSTGASDSTFFIYRIEGIKK